MGAKTITVSDPDTLEEHNISNQGYPMHYIGREKVAALGEIINNDVGLPLFKFAEEWGWRRADFLVVCPDKMDVRIFAFNEWRRKAKKGSYFLDARMGAELLRCYCVPFTPEAIKKYQDTLYTSADAVKAPCTAKSIIYTPLLAAAFLLNFIKKIGSKEKPPFEIIHDFVTGIHQENR